jgi:flagellar FliJ protein
MADSKYALLLRLSEEKLEAAAERMRQAQAQQNNAQAKLQQLNDFLLEYQARLKTGGVHGMAIDQWRDFQHFLMRLRDAVQTQQGELERCIQRFMLEKQSWQNERKQLKAYEKLMERERERAERAEARRAQKLTDEFATRRFWDRTHPDE